MKKEDIKIGGVYLAKVSGFVVRVRIIGFHPLGGWLAQNLATGRKIQIRTGGRLRRSAIPNKRRMKLGIARRNPSKRKPSKRRKTSSIEIGYDRDSQCWGLFDNSGHCLSLFSSEHEAKERLNSLIRKSYKRPRPNPSKRTVTKPRKRSSSRKLSQLEKDLISLGYGDLVGTTRKRKSKSSKKKRSTTKRPRKRTVKRRTRR